MFAIWLACLLVALSYAQSPSKPTRQSDLFALQSLYNATDGEHWTWKAGNMFLDVGIPWNFSQPSPNPCADDWQGVFCRCSTGVTYCTVTTLLLNHGNLSGTIPPELGNLTNLESLVLSDNHWLTGELPIELIRMKKLEVLDLRGNSYHSPLPPWLGQFKALRQLNLSSNFFYGPIPDGLFEATNITGLCLENNALNGTLPSSIVNLRNLTALEIAFNSLTGTIPCFFTELPHLHSIRLTRNHLHGPIPACLGAVPELRELIISSNFLDGTIPPELGNLTQLVSLYLGENHLTGTFPDTIANLDFLGLINVPYAHLTGTLPSSIATNIHLTGLFLNDNWMNGTIPSNLRNLQNLSAVELAYNDFSGPIEHIFHGAPSLKYFWLTANSLTGSLPMITSTELVLYDVAHNLLSGTIPTSYADLPRINDLALGYNFISGTIPQLLLQPTLLNTASLRYNCLTGTLPDVFLQSTLIKQLMVDHNYLRGSLPRSLGNISLIAELEISNNQFSGTLPVELTQMENIIVLFMSDNRLEGTLDNLVNSSVQHSLVNLDVSHNYFTGTIPTEPFRIPTLTTFAASVNCLQGSLPEAICESSSLKVLIFDGLNTATVCRKYLFPGMKKLFNAFTLTDSLKGSIPECIFSIPGLHTLHLSGNGLSGSLPSNFTMLGSNTTIDVSHNLLSGSIPTVLQDTPLLSLNLSYNRFDGVLSDSFAAPVSGSFGPAYTVTGSVVLYENRISGKVPIQLQRAPSVQILEGNMFHCNLQRSELPSSDPDEAIYICGSDGIDEAVYGYSLALGSAVCAAVALLVYALYKHQWQVRKVFQTWAAEWKEMHLCMRTFVPVAAIDGQLRRYPGAVSSLIDFFENIRVIYLSLAIFCCGFLVPLYTSFSSSTSTYHDTYGWKISAVLLSGSTATEMLIVCFGMSMSLFVIAVIRSTRRFDATTFPVKQRYLMVEAQARSMVLEGSPSHSPPPMPSVSFFSPLASVSHAPSFFIPSGGPGDIAGRVEGAENVDAAAAMSMTINSEVQNTSPADVAHTSPCEDGVGSNSISSLAFKTSSTCAVAGSSTSSRESAMMGQGGNRASGIDRPSADIHPGVSEAASSTTASISMGTASNSLSTTPAASLHYRPLRRAKISKYNRAVRRRSRMLAFILMNLVVMTAVDCAYIYIVLDFPGTVVLITQLCMAAFKILWNEVALWMIIPVLKVDWWAEILEESRRTSLWTALWNSRWAARYGYSTNDVRFMTFNGMLNNIIVPGVAIACVSSTCFHNALIASSTVSASYVIDVCTTYVSNQLEDSCVQTIPADMEVTYDPPFIYSYQCASTIAINYMPVFVFMFIGTGILIPFGKLLLYSVYHSPHTPSWLREKLEAIVPHRFRTPHPSWEGRRTTLFARGKLVVRIINYLAVVVAFGTIYPPISVMGCIAIFLITFSEQFIIGRLIVQADRQGKPWFRDELCRQCVGIGAMFRVAVRQTIPFITIVLGYLIFDTAGYDYSLVRTIIHLVIFLLWPIVAYLVWFLFEHYTWNSAPALRRKMTLLSWAGSLASRASSPSLATLDRGETNANNPMFTADPQGVEMTVMSSETQSPSQPQDADIEAGGEQLEKEVDGEPVVTVPPVNGVASGQREEEVQGGVEG